MSPISASSVVRCPRVALALFLLATPFAGAQESVFDSISKEVQQIFEKNRDAVVKVEAQDENGALSGTGFFIDPSGTIYTSYTIGGESREIVVSRGDKKYPATRLLADSRSGIAILKVTAETPYIRLGKASALGIAAPLIVIGYPMDLPITPNFGLVGGFDLKHNGRYFSTAHIRANIPVQRGEGGAPLLNASGEVVGILISSLENGTGCFALPIEAAEKVRQDFMRFGEVRPGWIGMNVGAAAQAQAGSSAEIQEVSEAGPAATSGLRKGDVLLQVGKTPIKSPEDVVNASFYLTAGDPIPVVVARENAHVSYNVLPADHPRHPSLQALIPKAPGEGVPLKIER